MAIMTLIKESIYLGLVCSFRDLVHFHHGGEHGRRQANKVLEQ